MTGGSSPPDAPHAPPAAHARNEDHIQWAVARVLDALGLVWAHPPNEALQRGDQASQGQRRASQAYGAKQVGLGVKAGLPDVLIFSKPPVGSRFDGVRGVALELKTEKGRMSPSQERWATSLKSEGWHVVTAYGLDHALAAIAGCGWDVSGALARLADSMGLTLSVQRDRLVAGARSPSRGR